MKSLFKLIVQSAELIEGTHCGNCQYTKDSKSKDASGNDLNEQGGTIPEGDEQMKMAKEGDLITMPGTPKEKIESKTMCTHDKIKQWVTPRMCCAYWDSPGTIRAYGDQEIGK